MRHLLLALACWALSACGDEPTEQTTTPTDETYTTTGDEEPAEETEAQGSPE